MSRYRILSVADRSQILNTCHQFEIENQDKMNPWEVMAKQYEKGIQMMENNSPAFVFNLFELSRTAPDDVEYWENVESEIADFLETEIGKMKDLM